MDLKRKLFMQKMAQVGKSSPGIPEQFAQYSTEAQDELMPLRPPSPPIHNSKSPKHTTFPQSTELPHWSEFFDTRDLFVRGEDAFRVYYTPSKTADAPLFVFHHGAGSSGLSFAVLAQCLMSEFSSDKEGETFGCGILTFDCRGHGETVVVERDYKLESLVDDAVYVVNEFRRRTHSTNNPVFLIGHSLGGAVFTSVCYQLVKEGVDVKGLGMFDIVEDTAVHSLQGMHTYLSNLPRSFDSLQSAIDWHMKTGLLRNRTSAEVSVPSYLREVHSGRYVWRIDLADTSAFWNTWFTGLSRSFVNAPTSKLLILAGTDSLDRELMIGQMQGKYQLVVFQDSGHFIQEDVPKKTAITLLDFWKRNDKKVVVIKSTWGSKK